MGVLGVEGRGAYTEGRVNAKVGETRPRRLLPALQVWAVEQFVLLTIAKLLSNGGDVDVVALENSAGLFLKRVSGLVDPGVVLEHDSHSEVHYEKGTDYYH